MFDPLNFVEFQEEKNQDSVTFAASSAAVKDEWIEEIARCQGRLPVRSNQTWNFRLQTFKDGPIFCDISKLVLPGLYLQGIKCLPKDPKEDASE